MTEQAAPPVITLRTLTITEFRDKGETLFREHYDEVAQDKTVPLDPDWPAYLSMEARELVLCIGAFVGEEFVGYSLNFILPAHLHYRGLCFVQNDIFFVLPSHRGKAGIGKESAADMLRAETKALGAKRGARKVFWHAKPDTAMAAWLKRKGCKVADIVFTEGL